MDDRFRVFDRYRPLIDDWEAFREALSRPLPVCVWTNTLRISPKGLAAHMAATGLDARPLPWLPGAYRLHDEDGPGARFEYLAGLYHVQEEVSLIPARLLEPRPGERVLDLCAAPGGKTAQIAVALANQGTVVANDRDFGRLTTLRSNLDRLGAVNVTTTEWDGANLPREVGLFDRVLVDVPCTCEGTSRKSPEVLAQIGPGPSLAISGVQRALLRKAVQLTRPGGRIVYSTCTYAPEENEAVVSEVMAESGDVLEILPVALEGFRTAPGLTAWQGRRFAPRMERALRVWPHHNDTGGFFVAVLKKTSATGGEPEPAPPIDERPDFETAPAGRWQAYLEERFGVSSSTLGQLHVFQRNRRQLGAVAAGHRPPLGPEPQTVGMSFLYPDMRFPKLTTAAARLLGPWIRHNAIEADRLQADAYLRRRVFALDPAQTGEVSGPGFLLVRHADIALGLGFARRREAGGFEVESLSPKMWVSTAAGEVLPGLLQEPLEEPLAAPRSAGR